MHVHSEDLRILRDTGFHPSKRDVLRDRFWAVFHASDPNAPIIGPILDFIFEDRPLDETRLILDRNDPLFFDHLIALKARTRWTQDASALTETSVPPLVDASLDRLIEMPIDWSLLQTMNHVWLANIAPARRLAVLTTVRNEGIDIVEWLAHYRVLGVDSIIVYTNDNDDGSDVLLNLLADAGVIRLIENKTTIDGAGHIKFKIFNHALSFVSELWNHEWVFFIDPDEFFISPSSARRALPTLIDQLDKGDAKALKSGLCINWKRFGSDREMKRRRGLLLERFIRSKPDNQVKTLSRLRDVTGFRTPHMPRLIAGGCLVDSGMADVPESNFTVEPTFPHGQLNHYGHKSFEEFVAKHARGDRACTAFFNFGNRALGAIDPPRLSLVAMVKAEMAELLAIPGVAAQVEDLELRFAQDIAAFDRSQGIAAVYAAASQAAAKAMR